MCNAVVTSMMLGAAAILPWVSSPALVIYTVNRQRPSHKLARVECAIEVCEETLKYAKSNCARNHLELTDATRRLLEAKLSASKIETQLLETQCYNMGGIGGIFSEPARHCAEHQPVCKGREGNSKIDPGGHCLTIEAERQRQFFEGIEELREVHDTVVSASACRIQTVNRRFESAATSM
ncbi:hypothetical protein DFH08DRAFT_797181 [Mycena albidolilacea]|uniref:Uncharacterized protein n=1 Tax=Mycena albidolilacea TaxID=1033008 RepID=A0AAD7AR07_9AGAR|nr:hypothetical protein DFH08DRAFT_797181 [Mycena albidolilacea]